MPAIDLSLLMQSVYVKASLLFTGFLIIANVVYIVVSRFLLKVGKLHKRKNLSSLIASVEAPLAFAIVFTGLIFALMELGYNSFTVIKIIQTIIAVLLTYATVKIADAGFFCFPWYRLLDADSGF